MGVIKLKDYVSMDNLDEESFKYIIANPEYELLLVNEYNIFICEDFRRASIIGNTMNYNYCVLTYDFYYRKL